MEGEFIIAFLGIIIFVGAAFIGLSLYVFLILALAIIELFKGGQACAELKT